MVALTISGKIYKQHFDNSVNADKLIVGLKHFHRAKAVKAFLEQYPEIHVEYLPPYAPNSIQKNTAMGCQRPHEEWRLLFNSRNSQES